ncbi:MAG: phasin family protein [Gammaproteobacteria bacterium]|nr:phasin family protein [Gammaproteobacteria bacterium]
MADNTEQFANQAQDATRAMFGAAQGLGETQMKILQRLGEIQQSMMQQTYEAANEQMQLLTRIRDPREFASAQADLVKNHGQRYTDSIKQVVDDLAQAWQEYGDRLENTKDTATGEAQKTASAAKDATKAPRSGKNT